MVTTRQQAGGSATKPGLRKEATSESTRKRKPSATPTESKKRKTPTTTAKNSQAAKKTKSEKPENEITINRAPVLKLWSACVAQFQYPSLSWSTCLSAGSAISSICATSKGKSIGAIETHDEGEKKTKKKQSDTGNLQVMQFKLKAKDGIVYVGDKKESSSEELLKKKFGDSYDEVKSIFEKALQTWKGHEDELEKRGWGRKGVLDLEMVKSAVTKE
ncbi:hypothetical protein EJ08DRAFT_700972 [Tothia fuscella]|uniref:Uncharacterized protein n=1 Tax=Tothia fuscella TaxID=1048955 RepID=A0A9P4NJG7_9PEZI|nr:hypothetical protein EJ08DRAFT_700972 [Tothia fuscella]